MGSITERMYWRSGLVFVVEPAGAGDGGRATVQAYDLTNGGRRLTFRPAGELVGFKVAPSRDRLAVASREVAYNPASRGAALVSERSTLQILDTEGTEIDRIESVRSFDWSPDSQSLVYVTGRYRGQYQDYDQTQTWLWDASSRRRRKIGDDGYSVFWATFDNRIYEWDRDNATGVPSLATRYDPVSGVRERTTHTSIYFSASGD